MSRRFVNNLNDEYFEWMYQLVCNEQYYDDLSYERLLAYLHDIEFTYILERDGNRADYGIRFRYRFGYENGYDDDTIREYLDTKPCSVLEMMVSLAFTIEETIMDDPAYGNRTGQWFWGMIVNLGLGTMCDNRFDRRYVDECIDRFLYREYKRNGEGGLFTIHDGRDMREAEIWFQAMWYLNEFIEG